MGNPAPRQRTSWADKGGSGRITGWRLTYPDLEPDSKQPMMETVWLNDTRPKVCYGLLLPGVDEDEAGGWTVDSGLEDRNRTK